MVSLVAQGRPRQEMWVRSLGWDDPLEKNMVAHFSIFAWEIPWAEEPGGLQSMGSQRIGNISCKEVTTNIFSFEGHVVSAAFIQL